MEITQTNRHVQTIEALSERYKNLNTKKIQTDANLENARKQLEEWREKARNDYGTDDITELQKKLENMKRKNEEDIYNYQKKMDEIEEALTKVERENTQKA